MRAVKAFLFIAVVASLPLGVTAQQGRTLQGRTVVVSRTGWIGIGVNLTTINTNGQQTESLTINDVVPNSPAARAGLKKGERIVRIDGEVVTSSSFDRIARGIRTGDSVKLRVAYGNNERDVTLVAEDRPAEYFVYSPGNDIFNDSIQRRTRILLDSARVRAGEVFRMQIMSDSLFRERFANAPPFRLDSIFGNARIRILGDSTLDINNFMFGLGEGDGMFRRIETVGMVAVAGAEFEPINEGLGHYFGTDKGLLVLRVIPETPAARAGLQSGDVVVRADGRPIDTVVSLRQALGRGTASVPVEVLRRGKTVKIELRTQRN